MRFYPIDAAALALIISGIEAVKRVFPTLDKRWLPLLAIGFGIGWAVGTRYGGEVFTVALTGLAIGLSAVGLFSSGRAVRGS